MKNVFYKTYLRGSKIISKFDNPNCLFFITSGIILKMDGDIIIKSFYPNEYVDLAYINTSFLHDYICKTNVNVNIIDIEEINYKKLYEELSKDYIRLEYQNTILSCKTPIKKVTMFIYLKYKELNTTSFSIPYNKEELSNYLGLPKSFLKEALDYLNNKKIIASKGYLYNILNLNLLILELNEESK